MSGNSPHESFLRQAIELALEKMRTGQSGPFGAVIVKEGRVIGRGWNSVTSTNDPTAHAEVVAIREACKNLNSFQLDGCEVYSSCEPCPMCLGAIYWARPKAVYFASSRVAAARAGFDDDFIYEELTKPLDARTLPIRQLIPRAGDQVFEAWKQKTDKVEY